MKLRFSRAEFGKNSTNNESVLTKLFNDMKKIGLAFLMLVLMSFNLYSQQLGCGLNAFIKGKTTVKSNLKLFPERFSITELEGKEYISLLAELKQGKDVAELQRYDCKLSSRAGNIVCIKANVEFLRELLDSGLFERVDVARKIGSPHLDKALVDVNADYVHQGVEGLEQGYDGSGVIIGIADWGFDYTHPVFYDTLMNQYRVIAAWDQYRSGFAPPEGFDYGAYIEGQENLLAAQSDTNNIYDIGLHGTHVAGIAGGGGAGTRYKGVAYGAEFLFATWLIDETNVLDAYSWMRDEAKNRGKRLVVNNSWGIYHFGAMDGSSLFDEFVYNMSVEDSVVFVSSSGNNRRSDFHIKCDFNNYDTLRSEAQFNIPVPSSDDYWGQTINMVADSVNSFSSAIELYSAYGELLFSTEMFNTDSEIVTNGVFVYNESDSLVYRLSAVKGSNGQRAQMEWEIRLSNYNSLDKVNLISTAECGYVHAWNVACLTTGVGNWGMPFVSRGVNSVNGDDEYSIGEPAIGRGMIAVAAHTSGRRNSYSNSNIAPFSSKGPNLCPYIKPEISAPGVSVVSALSSYTTDERSGFSPVEFNSRTYKFVALSGTSMSSPMVTGIVALMLQANKNLTPEQVKEIITTTSRTDSFTGDVPNYDWGYGKIDALNAVKKALQLVGLESIGMESDVRMFPNPTNGVLYVENIPSDCEFITIHDICGREIKRFESPNNSLDVKMIPNGIYLLKLHINGKMLNFKFVKQ